MHIFLKVLWGTATIICLISIAWFILGISAGFKRSFDLVSTVIFFFVCIPAILFSILSIIKLINGVAIENRYSLAGIVLLIVIHFGLSFILVKNVDTVGWLSESVTSDTLKKTSDDKYEYRLDIVNLFQKNSYARIYIRNLKDNEEYNIPLNIPTNKIVGLLNARNDKEKNWIHLETTSEINQYMLYITKELMNHEQSFIVDMTSQSIRESR